MFAQLGWNEFFARQLSAHSGRIGRICGQEKGLYRIWLEPDLTVFATLTGRLRSETTERTAYPAVGDWVSCEPSGDDRFLIKKIFERRGLIARRQVGGTSEGQVIAANVDWLFVAVSANSDLNMNRLDRYLTLAHDSGCTPVILLTKTDLVENPQAVLEQLHARFPGVAVHGLSTLQNSGRDALTRYLQSGMTAALVGSSGVGKSTLTNLLIGEQVLKTSAIREEDGRGRHTTTARHMLQIPGGAVIIDTPGMRELHLIAGEEALSDQFEEIEARMRTCRFSDCQHRTEPGCKVLEGLADGSLQPERWQSFLKLQAEIRLQAGKRAKAERFSAKKKTEQWKKRRERDE